MFGVKSESYLSGNGFNLNQLDWNLIVAWVRRWLSAKFAWRCYFYGRKKGVLSFGLFHWAECTCYGSMHFFDYRGYSLKALFAPWLASECKGYYALACSVCHWLTRHALFASPCSFCSTWIQQMCKGLSYWLKIWPVLVRLDWHWYFSRCSGYSREQAGIGMMRTGRMWFRAVRTLLLNVAWTGRWWWCEITIDK